MRRRSGRLLSRPLFRQGNQIDALQAGAHGDRQNPRDALVVLEKLAVRGYRRAPAPLPRAECRDRRQRANNLYSAALGAGAVAWVFDSEGQGLRAAVLAATHLQVPIPMPGACESLNVVVAAICRFETVRRRLPGAGGGDQRLRPKRSPGGGNRRSSARARRCLLRAPVMDRARQPAQPWLSEIVSLANQGAVEQA